MLFLSVVLPIRNEEAFITGTLQSLVDQDYPKDRYEIIVVDGCSTDATRTVVRGFIQAHSDVNISLLDNPGKLSSRARNIGARAARGQMIAVIDGHVLIPNRQLFTTMERLKEKHQAICLGRPAPLLLPGLEKGRRLWIALARASWLAHSRGSYIYSDYCGFVDPTSNGFAYDRSVFERVGYFDENFDAAEDFEFHFRLKQAGILAYTAPELTIFSYPRATLRGLFRQMERYGIGRARLARKHPKAFSKETLVPAVVFLLFAVAPLAVLGGWRFPLAGLGYFAAIAAYWSVLLFTGAALAWKRGHLFAAGHVALAIWTTHMGLGYGFLKATVKP